VDDQGVVVRPDQVTLGVLVTAVPRDAVDAAGSCPRMSWRT
jgi:hypothetical protein